MKSNSLRLLKKPYTLAICEEWYPLITIAEFFIYDPTEIPSSEMDKGAMQIPLPIKVIANNDLDNLTVTDLSLPFIPFPINNAPTPNSLSSIPQEFIPIKESTTLKSDIVFKFKNPDGGEYETSITSSKVIEDLTRSQLTQEALNRHLIKKTQAPAIIIETEECGKMRVGNQNDDLILTKHGRAYFIPDMNNTQILNIDPETYEISVFIEN